MLKRGYRHVFVCLDSDGWWVMYDPRAGLPVIQAVQPDTFDLATFFREQGYLVVETEQAAKPIMSPIIVSNCVGMVKVILGIRAWWIQTPYRLFNHLMRDYAP